MSNTEFYDSIKLIANQKSKVALININEFKRLKRINGEYKWVTFKIGNLPAIPIKTDDFKEAFRGTDELVNIRLTPIWTYLTNGEQIITPKIETFEFTEHSKFRKHYTLIRKSIPNHHFLSNSNWQSIFDKALAQRENAIEWHKRGKSTLLASADAQTLQLFLRLYKSELKEFNALYEESAKTAKELNSYQKRLK